MFFNQNYVYICIILVSFYSDCKAEMCWNGTAEYACGEPNMESGLFYFLLFGIPGIAIITVIIFLCCVWCPCCPFHAIHRKRRNVNNGVAPVPSHGFATQYPNNAAYPGQQSVILPPLPPPYPGHNLQHQMEAPPPYESVAGPIQDVIISTDSHDK